MPTIHPTAVVDPRAELADGVSIGAGSVVDAGVAIAEDTWIGHHVVITGATRIGRNNRIFHFGSIGEAPQDKKYGGEPTHLEIGDGNTIREFCTINRGTAQDRGITRLGNDNWIMAYAHVAHDCTVGDHTIFANSAQVAGHVSVGDWAILGGMSGVHQFCRVGAHAMIGACSLVLQDVPPYVLVAGNTAQPHGINSEGLRRRGFAPDQIAAIKRAYRTIYKSGLSLEEARAELAALVPAHPEFAILVDFLAAGGRGIIR